MLLTGATGFVGKEILDRFLDRGRRVFALVRAEDDVAAARRLSPHARLTPVAGDIERPGLGLAAPTAATLAEEVTTVVHCAASVSFDLSLAASRRVNVDGTRHVLDLAERCERLERLSYVSTAYVAGEPRRLFGEDELDVGQRFRNPYERSKFEAERMLRERADGMPLQVLRPSIVVGDSRTGRTSSFNVLYGPLKAFARGAIPAIPARRASPVDIVPVNYVADQAVNLADGGPDGTYHLVAGRNATTVGRLLELAAAQLGRRAPAVLPPTAYRRLLHPLLRRRYSGLRRMEVYFPYFSMRVRFDDRRLGPAPPVEGYFHRLVDFAERARWGRAGTA
ncbi:MAG TPA: SDR family oxidoreductase [Thermoleophilaceae bacterium]|nr:SDR family oxidoreductase [Thermoleophilaceae bacterium]